MTNPVKAIIDKMFDAFAKGNIDELIKTLSEDTVWIYHGTHRIPKATFKGKEGVAQFFTNILYKTEMISFQPQQFITEDNTVVVLGEEHQRIKKTGEEIKQKWVQVYTVENGLITRMEEFASTQTS